jgi:hypothetical protein
MPSPRELVAAELELEVALAQPGVRVADRLPAPAVPDDDAAGSVLALRNRTLEFGVLERMVLRLDRHPLVGGTQARSLGDRPALEDAVQLEPEVIVETARGVLLDHVAQLGARSLVPSERRARGRLRGAVEVALAIVLAQSAAQAAHGRPPSAG